MYNGTFLFFFKKAFIYTLKIPNYFQPSVGSKDVEPSNLVKSTLKRLHLNQRVKTTHHFGLKQTNIGSFRTQQLGLSHFEYVLFCQEVQSLE